MTDEMSLTVFDPIKSQIAELQEKDSKLVFDHKTADGERELRSYVRRLRSHKTTIADLHKTTKQGAVTFGRQVDAIKNELTEGVQKIIDARMKPLDDIEAAKRAAAEAIVEAERLATEKAYADHLADLKRREAEVAAKEAEQREVERFAREKRIAEEAREKALREAEHEKQHAIDAERERVRKEAEAVQAEKDRLAEIERKRIVNEEHRKKVEAEVLDALDGCTGDHKVSKNVLFDLVQGSIPHVIINY